MGQVSAVGIAVTHWITYHGIAINVDCNIEAFKQIIPCGIDKPGISVCNINENYSINYDSLLPKVVHFIFYKVGMSHQVKFVDFIRS